MTRKTKQMLLPEKISNLLADEKFEIDNIGMSEASVLIYEDKILKVQEYNVENGLVDLDDVEPDTFGENGFKDPAELF